MTVGQATNLLAVQNLARQQRVGDVEQTLFVLGEKHDAAIVVVGDDSCGLRRRS